MGQMAGEKSTIGPAVRRITQRFAQGWKDNPRTLAILFFTMNLFLIAPVLNPSLIDLGPFDEMIHINSGRELADGNLPNVAGHPFLALLYAIAYLPIKGTPYWIIQNAILGRLILFCMMWWGAYLVAERLTDYSPPLIVAGIMLVSPLMTELFLNPSDALFAAMSAFSLWQFLLFITHKNVRNLFFTSILLGLAALSRGDGLVLFIPFTIISVAVTFSSMKSGRERARFLTATILPFVIIVYGYVLIYGLSTGEFELGLTRYSYISFEHGHEALFHSQIGNATLEAAREATRIFGTPAENNYFFLNAIRRNPGPYFERLKVIFKQLPSTLLTAYGKRYAALLFLFALRGAWVLIKKKSFLLLSILVVWTTHLGSYFLVGFVRMNYLRMPFFIVFSLASIGLYAILSGYDNRREKLVISLTLITLAAYSLVDNKLAIFVGVSIFLLGFWIIWYVMNRYSELGNMLIVGLALCLSLGLTIRAGYPSPGFQTFGDETIEQAVVFMMENLEPGSRVIASEPGYVLAARMNYVSFPPKIRDFDSSDEFYQWLVDNDIKAIRSTSWLTKRDPEVWALIEDQMGKGLEVIFRKDPGDIMILRVREP